MKKFLCLLLSFLIMLSLFGCSESETKSQKKIDKNFNYTMLKGVNLSALEDKNKPDSFLENDDTYLGIAEKGFDHIRLPVDFRNHADSNGKIESSFFERLDNIIELGNNSGLFVVLDFHGWIDLNIENGDDLLFLNIWENIAKHYANNRIKSLAFELINEPHTTEGGDLDMINLMDLQTKAIEKIRAHDPKRKIIIATAEWNGPWTLSYLPFPDYENLVVAVHTYEPLDFTHQGQFWAGTADIDLELTDEMLNGLISQLELITQFKETTGCDVILNEFGLITNGAISDEDIHDYLSCIIKYTKEHNIPWTYWCYSDAFGVYNPGFLGIGSGWRQNVLDALMK